MPESNLTELNNEIKLIVSLSINTFIVYGLVFCYKMNLSFESTWTTSWCPPPCTWCSSPAAWCHPLSGSWLWYHLCIHVSYWKLLITILKDRPLFLAQLLVVLDSPEKWCFIVWNKLNYTRGRWGQALEFSDTWLRIKKWIRNDLTVDQDFFKCII